MMDDFTYRENSLYAEDVALADIARQWGTPCYVYSRAALERHWHAFDQALHFADHLVCYAVKANSCLAVLNVLARMGSGFDIVSVGELERVLAAGGDPHKVVFSGVGKREDELVRALEAGIRCFNVEVEDELARLNRLALDRKLRAPVSIRVNPDVDAMTHPYISTGLRENKFGIAIDRALELYRQAASLPGIEIRGIDCHIGSQLVKTAPFEDALQRILLLVDALQEGGITLAHLDIGGGLGIRYRDEVPPTPAAYASALAPLLRGRGLEILVEPGRAIAGNAGVLLTRVEYLKRTGDRNFAIVDAAMNDLLRPSLYQAWMDIVPLERPLTSGGELWDIVGPVCETGDFLGKERVLAAEAGMLLAVRSAGAYGFAMASNYNSRPRPAEVMVDGSQMHLVRPRESLASLYAGEQVLP
ncbi:MAG: hypothetical protein RIQ52_1965 [Pseudomonadota bacterium]|jgi:diaminopimelate decarboxylase